MNYTIEKERDKLIKKILILYLSNKLENKSENLMNINVFIKCYSNAIVILIALKKIF